MPSSPQLGHGAAQYNNFVACQKNVPTTNNDGQLIPNWVTQFSRWAMVIPRGEGEKRIFEQLRAEVDHLVRLRFDPEAVTISPTDWRFLMEDGTTLNIGNRVDVERRRIELEFRCMEVQTAP